MFFDALQIVFKNVPDLFVILCTFRILKTKNNVIWKQYGKNCFIRQPILIVIIKLIIPDTALFCLINVTQTTLVSRLRDFYKEIYTSQK